jgi:hypothetical protein
MEQTETAGTATIRLSGHPPVGAELAVRRYPTWAWIGRVITFALAWVASTVVTLVLTFDPFVASFPGVLGMGLVYRGVRGRYRVDHFEGACPRCTGPLRLEPGSKIGLPHRFDCYGCHFTPELHLGS